MHFGRHIYMFCYCVIILSVRFTFFELLLWFTSVICTNHTFDKKMEMPYQSMDTNEKGFKENDIIDGKLNNVETTNIPLPEWIENATCYTPKLLNDHGEGEHFDSNNITGEDVLKFLLLCVSSILTVVFNIIFIMVMNEKKFKKRWIRSQPRCIFISIAMNDLTMGLLVLSFCVYPVLYKCWPFGRTFCQIQVCDITSVTVHTYISFIYSFKSCFCKCRCMLLSFYSFYVDPLWLKLSLSISTEP